MMRLTRDDMLNPNARPDKAYYILFNDEEDIGYKYTVEEVDTTVPGFEPTREKYWMEKSRADEFSDKLNANMLRRDA